METSLIIQENIKRNYIPDFNPLTGAGAPLLRQKLEIPDFFLPEQYVPAAMLDVPLVKKIQHDGSIRDFIEKSLHVTYSEEDRDKIKAELEDLPKDQEILEEEIAKGHNYVFVGKAGSFIPIKPGLGGGLLVRLGVNGRYDSVGGSKGFRWVESESLEHIPDAKQMIDMNYFKDLIDTAIDTIEAFGDFQMFVAGEDNILTPEDRVLDINIDPWLLPCGTESYENCSDCPNFSNENYGYRCKLGYNIENVIMTD